MNRSIRGHLIDAGLSAAFLLCVATAAYFWSSPARAQAIVSMPTVFVQHVQTVPGAIPTSSTCLVGYASTCGFVIKRTQTSTDPYVCTGDLAATGQTITIQDANGTVFINNVLGSSGSVQTTAPLPMGGAGDPYCRDFPGGVYWYASGTGATGRLTIAFNP